jgi:type II secretory pathway predicted ATPase ExeA/nucleoid-associated protein YgaU
MYYRHFGLEGPPFRFTPSAAPLFLSSAHRECLAALEWALVHDECGFMLMLGETGTGKTTLLNAIRARRIPRLRLACVANPRLSFEEMMRVVLPQLGLRTDQRGKLELIQQFEAVVSNRLEGHRTAIVIDEAQDLSDETLEDLRLLANRIGPQEQELQIVLMGHPELLDRLSARNLRQLRERISTKVLLLPLSAEESVAYVECRLAAQGGTARHIFKPKALRYLVDAAAGIPRRLNVLCHNALVLAFSKNASVVTMDMAVEVVNEYQSILGPSPAASAPAPVSVPVHVASSSAHNPILLDEKELAVAPHRKSIYAAGACAAVALIGFGRLLFATTQNWTEEVNRAVPAIARIVKPANPQPSAELYAEDRSVEPRVSVPAGIAPVSVRGAMPVVHASPVAVPIASRRTVSAPASKAIRIQAGDTFHDLAAKYLGSKYRARDLIKANPQISDPNLLYVGETVYLPSVRKNDESRLVQ